MRIGDFIETFTGRKFWPLDPSPEDVAIEDIAHSLSHICRFNGHCNHFYSVARHSLKCSYLVTSNRMRLLCLLHDASEAYLYDVPRPLKPFLPEYRTWENRVQSVIWEAFDIPPPNQKEKSIISEIDEILLLNEAEQLMHFNGWKESAFEKPVFVKISLCETYEDCFVETPSIFIGTFNVLQQRIKESAK